MVTTDNLSNGVDNRILRKQIEDNLYGDLTNWRVKFGLEHKRDVLNGYSKIRKFMLRGLILSSKKVEAK